ncbi:MAG: undecaprenyl-phosphate glucose phosphotransferase [Steroidobacteraceae bacterium]
MSDNPKTGATTLRSHPVSNDVNSCDSAFIFIIKALLYPVTAVAFLALCLWCWNRPLAGSYFLVAVIAFAGVGELLDLSKLEYLKSSLRAFKYILARWYALSLCILLLLYLSKVGVRWDDPPLLTWMLLAPLMLWSVHLATWGLLLKVGVKHMQSRSAVIVGVTDHGLHLAHMLKSQPLLGIRCQGFFEDQQAEKPVQHNLSELPELSVLGGSEELSQYVRQHNIQMVFVTLPISRNPRLLKLLDELHDSVASVYFVPDMFALSLIEARVEVVHGVPLIAVCESPFYGVRGMVKRCSDVLLSSLILIAISPILMAVAIGVKWSSPGPVIFKQRRYGLDGREIMVYKFRSMTVTEDGQKQYTQVTRGDARVTKFGAFIRRTSLDELPQFLNVLEGTMSVVGPRPHAVAVNERYRAQINSYMIRHKVKPGITGWAQVNGYRGGDDLPTMTKRIEFDLKYLANWSLWLDLQIILRTLIVVVKDRHAF